MNQSCTGRWKFKFKADGTNLSADTKSMALGDKFILPNDTEITLDQLMVNDLEQRISFSYEQMGVYDLKLYAEDEQGRTTEFHLSSLGDGDVRKGYLKNDRTIYSGRIAEDARTLTVTLYALKMPPAGGVITGSYEQVGKAVVWDLTKLR